MAAVYLDTSALYKLILPEPESEALRDFLRDFPERVASALARLEVARALLRNPPLPLQPRERAAQVLQQMILLAVDEPLLARAAELLPATLRSLDAIHLASALAVPGLAGMVVYDRRLAVAATQQGLRVWSPGREPGA